MSRRERFRDLTRDDIKRLARQQMSESGTAALSLGAIARAMDLTPSALYRYYASRDELITALIIDAYNALADALVAAAAAYAATDYLGRLLATSLAYRVWALQQPVDFLLIFGNPIPGYQVPDAATVEAAQRVFSAFLGILQAGADAGVLRPLAEHVRLAAALGAPVPQHSALRLTQAAVGLSGVAAWTKLHGMVMLELVGHLPFAIADPGQFYHAECLRLLDELIVSTADSS